MNQSCDNAILEDVFSNTDVLYAYMDTDFNFIRVNRAYAEADGREPDFYVGRNHFDLFPYGENEAIFRRVVETGEPYIAKAKAFEYAEHPERGVSYWDWTLHPIRGESGELHAVLLSLTNSTERKRVEEALRESEDNWRTLVKNIPDLVATLSPDGGILAVNHTLSGDPVDEAIGSFISRPARAIHRVDADGTHAREARFV